MKKRVSFNVEFVIKFAAKAFQCIIIKPIGGFYKGAIISARKINNMFFIFYALTKKSVMFKRKSKFLWAQ